MAKADFYFDGELNYFLPASKQQVSFTHCFKGRASIKDMIEALGVPHPEVNLIVVNGESVDFSYIVEDGDRIQVYPVSRTTEVASSVCLRSTTLPDYRFVLDIHLGKLANSLRMLGFDTLYRNDYADEELAEISASQQRILLTRDKGLLMRSRVTYGYYVRATNPEYQVVEVLRRFDLFKLVKPFQRCIRCNGLLVPVTKESILDQLPQKTQLEINEFHRCGECSQIYWKGAHYERMQQFVEGVLESGVKIGSGDFDNPAMTSTTKMVVKFSDIVEKLGNTTVKCNSLKVHPNLNPDITGVAPIDEASSSTLSYIEGAKFAAWIGKTGASALILPLDEGLQAEADARGIAWIGVSEPRLVFAQAIALFYKPWQPAPEIHPTAVIHPEVQLGEDVYIGPYVVVQAGVKIGNRVCIHPNVVIYPEVQIGDRTVLHANCTIHERSQIGADCVIHSGVVIGGEGFGFVPTAEGWLKMEQSGYTVLEDGVEVGCNSTIDRPAVGETRIGRNTKIDNLVQIGHGCQVGQNCAIAAQVGLAGGVKVGNRVILAGQVGVANQAKIGDEAIASAKAGIHNDVEPGAIVSGVPAVPHKLFLKASAIYNRLPEMYQTLKRLQRQN